MSMSPCSPESGSLIPWFAKRKSVSGWVHSGTVKRINVSSCIPWTLIWPPSRTRIENKEKNLCFVRFESGTFTVCITSNLSREKIESGMTSNVTKMNWSPIINLTVSLSKTPSGIATVTVLIFYELFNTFFLRIYFLIHWGKNQTIRVKWPISCRLSFAKMAERSEASSQISKF